MSPDKRVTSTATGLGSGVSVIIENAYPDQIPPANHTPVQAPQGDGVSALLCLIIFCLGVAVGVIL